MIFKIFPFVITFLIGIAVGSFAGLCSFRIPRGESVVLGRSYCDHCGTHLSWLQKLPLFGYLLLHGKSRCCHKTISVKYPILETITGLVFILLFSQFSDVKILLSNWLFAGLLVVGVYMDLEHKIIPDKITLTGIAAGVALAGILSSLKLTDPIWGLLLCGGFLYASGRLGEFIFRKPEVMGGGDIKFAAMIGTFLGWQLGLTTIMVAAFSGVVFGCVRMGIRPESRHTREIRFGPFLGAGALLVLIYGNTLNGSVNLF
ncbi:MAG: prepilin peptidase [bacterium]